MGHRWIDLGEGFSARVEQESVVIASRRGGVRVPLSTWRDCVMRVEDQAASSEGAPTGDAEAPSQATGDSDPAASESPDAPNDDLEDDPISDS